MIDAAVARVLLEASLRVSLVAVAVAAVLKLARIESSTVRHAAWTSVVAAMLLMPLLPYVLPSFDLPGRSSLASRMATVPDGLPYVGDVVLTDTIGTSVLDPRPAADVAGASVALAAPLSPPSVPATRSLLGPMPLWLVAALAIYGVGVGMLLIRWVLAARFISKLRRESVPVATPIAADVFESALAATPITVGVLKPWIVLPAEWKTWSAAKLAGVLAHEHAHVERRDPLIAIVAYMNRCIFWFHPLAWWLERKLASTAEDAADDAGARAMGQEREYAEVLVEMAAIVRRNGGRVAWQGVGVDGNGLLSQRIDRLLSGRLFREVSRMKKTLIAVVCAMAVFIVVACRPRVEAAALKPDPKLAEVLATNRARSTEFDQAKALTKEGAEALEAKVRANPEDLDSRRKLLVFYRWNGWNVVGTQATVANRRAHVLWLIEHKPEDDVTANWGYLNPTGDLADPEGYEAGKKLWLAHVDEPTPSANVLSRAIGYLAIGDLPAAERVILRARALEPAETRWTSSLANVYALAITGRSGQVEGRPTSSDPARANSTFAKRVRQQMAETTDAGLLSYAAMNLFRRSSLEPSDLEANTLARGFLERAVNLDPQSPDVLWAEATFRDHDVQRRAFEMEKAAGSKVKQLEAVKALPAPDQFALLPYVADYADMSGEADDYYRHDTAKAKAEWAASKEAARTVLALAPKFMSDPYYGPNVFRANCVLGLNALRDGNRAEAVKYLTAAGEASPSPYFGAAMTLGRYYNLTNYLLKYGERESVAVFYDRLAHLLNDRMGGRQRFADAASAIRAGTMPPDYQRFFDRVDSATGK